MASSTFGQIATLCDTLTARLEDMTAATRTAHKRAHRVALTKLKLDVATFSGHHAGKSVTVFQDDFVLYETVSGVSDHDWLRRVLPVAVRSNAAQWLRLQHLFLSWDQFVVAFRAEFLPVDNDYRIRGELNAKRNIQMSVCEKMFGPCRSSFDALIPAPLSALRSRLFCDGATLASGHTSLSIHFPPFRNLQASPGK
ncbi:hypothetical protein HPB49_005407 [Dermacentor silvarum]|uniref:Uncharacterized protein n=1 Tax=Dermacentor silvarum TaxID=543639 RepID=A0ACB8DAS6_DERSI|nr:hypothetical protein HPB49_005407 [Dermacentor silvarum]